VRLVSSRPAGSKAVYKQLFLAVELDHGQIQARREVAATGESIRPKHRPITARVNTPLSGAESVVEKNISITSSSICSA